MVLRVTILHGLDQMVIHLFTFDRTVAINIVYCVFRPTPWPSRAASALANGAAYVVEPASQLPTTASVPAVHAKYSTAAPTTGLFYYNYSINVS